MWKVTLRMYSGDRLPIEVTRALGVEPSSQQLGRWNEEAQATSRNGWFLSSEERLDSPRLDDQLSWLITSVGAGWRELESLRAAGWDIDVDCLGDEGEDVAFRLRAETLAFFGTRRLDVQFWWL
jgi:hypothetical protein